MEQWVSWVLAAGLGVAAVGLWRRLIAAGSARKMARAGYLDLCQPLFTGSFTKVAETGFPRLSGQYRGQKFDIQVVPDTLSYRKLPTLWLLVSLPAALPLTATFDLMLRPTGLESFSNFARLPRQIALPAGFPDSGAIRSDNPAAMADEAILRRHLAAFAGEGLKELLVAPSGVRVVWLVEEADRGRYLLFRDGEMGRYPLAARVLQPLLAGVQDLWRDLAAEPGKPGSEPEKPEAKHP